jgi:hypothetical protein
MSSWVCCQAPSLTVELSINSSKMNWETLKKIIVGILSQRTNGTVWVSSCKLEESPEEHFHEIENLGSHLDLSGQVSMPPTSKFWSLSPFPANCISPISILAERIEPTSLDTVVSFEAWLFRVYLEHFVSFIRLGHLWKLLLVRHEGSRFSLAPLALFIAEFPRPTSLFPASLYFAFHICELFDSVWPLSLVFKSLSIAIPYLATCHQELVVAFLDALANVTCKCSTELHVLRVGIFLCLRCES